MNEMRQIEGETSEKGKLLKEEEEDSTVETVHEEKTNNWTFATTNCN